MTQEQYNRATKIHERLKELNAFVNDINRYSDPKLNYTYYSCAEHKQLICDELKSKLIDIFIRHDRMIRKEIDAEIEKLKKEIEGL